MYTLLVKEVEVDMNKKSNVSIILDTQHVYVLHVCAISFLFFFFPSATCFDFSFVNSAPVQCLWVPQILLFQQIFH